MYTYTPPSSAFLPLPTPRISVFATKQKHFKVCENLKFAVGFSRDLFLMISSFSQNQLIKDEQIISLCQEFHWRGRAFLFS